MLNLVRLTRAIDTSQIRQRVFEQLKEGDKTSFTHQDVFILKWRHCGRLSMRLCTPRGANAETKQEQAEFEIEERDRIKPEESR